MPNPDINLRWEVYLEDAAETVATANAEMVAIILSAAQDGMTQRDIGKHIGRSAGWVNAVLRDNGLKYQRKFVPS
jgi:hypothetical protein